MLAIGREVMERPQELPKNLPGVEVIALQNLAVRDHHSKTLNEDECEDTRAEGFLEIPVVDRFGELLGQSNPNALTRSN